MTECLPYARYHLHILANRLEGQNHSRIMSILQRSTLKLGTLRKFPKNTEMVNEKTFISMHAHIWLSTEPVLESVYLGFLTFKINWKLRFLISGCLNIGSIFSQALNVGVNKHFLGSIQPPSWLFAISAESNAYSLH